MSSSPKVSRKRAANPDYSSFKEQCGKVGYLSRKDARKAASRIRRTDGEHTRAYECDDCGLFHHGHLPSSVRAGNTSGAAYYGRAQPTMKERDDQPY